MPVFQLSPAKAKQLAKLELAPVCIDVDRGNFPNLAKFSVLALEDHFAILRSWIADRQTKGFPGDLAFTRMCCPELMAHEMRIVRSGLATKPGPSKRLAQNCPWGLF